MALAIPRPAVGRLGEVLEDPEVIWRRLAPVLPIQAAVDIAVPLSVVWRRLIALETLPEGLHQVVGIRRRGRRLIGFTDDRSRRRWRAEVTEERPEESFAWRSRHGSDCAGLITVHRLSERLTRLELTLDLAPCSALEAMALRARVAQRRTDRELRELKARLERISPDDYDQYDG
jgi:uncharacterized membrane protein